MTAQETLEEVLDVMCQGEQEGVDTVRLHTGDPALYGALGSRWMRWKSGAFPYV